MTDERQGGLFDRRLRYIREHKEIVQKIATAAAQKLVMYPDRYPPDEPNSLQKAIKKALKDIHAGHDYIVLEAITMYIKDKNIIEQERERVRTLRKQKAEEKRALDGLSKMEAIEGTEDAAMARRDHLLPDEDK